MSTRVTNVVVAIAAGAISFAAAYGWQTRPTSESIEPAGDAAVLDWLGRSGERRAELHNADPGFAEQRAGLESKLDEARRQLADALAAPDVDDAALRSAVEAVLSAHSALERRVAEHLLVLRPLLSADERVRLFGRLADGVRQCGRERGRYGQGGDSPRGGPPDDRGRRGRGPGGKP